MTESHFPSSAESKGAKDFYDMSGPDLLDYCGADAGKWAEAFCKIKEAQGWGASDIDEGLMITWFANAIEHSAMVRRTPDVAQPVAWTNEHQLGYLKDPEWASVPMAMWGKPNGAARIPLYASQPSPAATVETNSPEQDRESDCKTNPELTGHSPKERGERVLPHLSAANEDAEKTEVAERFKLFGEKGFRPEVFGIDDRVPGPMVTQRDCMLIAAALSTVEPQSVRETDAYRDTVMKVSAAREKGYAAARANLQEAWAAMALIRETVETLGPIGAVPAAEHLDGPTFMHEAEAIVNGIQALALSRPQSK